MDVVRWLKRVTASLVGATALAQSACAPSPRSTPSDAIVIGALLPFTGKEAAIGRNLEQAMLLAVDDVNRAGGIAGRPLALQSRDSHSGSSQGFDELLQLLYADEVRYFIGPEENDLANGAVPDVKGLDVLNILPAYAAPAFRRISTRGAWVRLAPSPTAMACGMAKLAIRDGVRTANAIVTQDDYNQNLAAEFNAEFERLGGDSLPSITVNPSATTYVRQIRQAFQYGTDSTLLIAYPAAASNIATEWTIMGRRGSWYLSPMLHADVFLLNTPYGSLDGNSGISPSLSLPHECETLEDGRFVCARDNAQGFARHFHRSWGGDAPLPAAHFYYDAVVLLAMGLQYSLATESELPSSARLRDIIRRLGDRSELRGGWAELEHAFGLLASGTPVRYVGAAAEYDFDEYAIAEHVIFDTWKIERNAFVDTGPIMAYCPRVDD